MAFEINENHLKQWILDENKVVTTGFVTRRCSMSNTEIESLFQKFYNDYKNGNPPVHATFMFYGETENDCENSSCACLLSSDEKIEEARKRFANIERMTIHALHQEASVTQKMILEAEWSCDGIESSKPSTSKVMTNKSDVVDESPMKRKNAKHVETKDIEMDDVSSSGTRKDCDSPGTSKETKSEAENVIPVKRDRKNESNTSENGKSAKKVSENYIDENGVLATRIVDKNKPKEGTKGKATANKNASKKASKSSKSKKLPANQPKLTDFFFKQ
ncbi:hypothetical protein M3Y94_01315600 [Aphelenchoides besseyi]|nr:hypothetical protein M3Y94_01315600 [Aphelenchoides besseyi]